MFTENAISSNVYSSNIEVEANVINKICIYRECVHLHNPSNGAFTKFVPRSVKEKSVNVVEEYLLQMAKKISTHILYLFRLSLDSCVCLVEIIALSCVSLAILHFAVLLTYDMAFQSRKI